MRRTSLPNLDRPRAQTRSGRCRRAFTLVEVMVVVIILGVLASIMIPQFTGATREAREKTLREDLRFLRSQVQVFRVQHRDVPPGYPGGMMSSSPTEADFIDQMLTFTSENCDTSTTTSSTFRFGPYLSRVPANPINNQTAIYMVANNDPIPTALPMMNGSNEYGWIYKAQTQQWVANLASDDQNGTPFSSY
jgi:general secretion pathway protein G